MSRFYISIIEQIYYFNTVRKTSNHCFLRVSVEYYNITNCTKLQIVEYYKLYTLNNVFTNTRNCQENGFEKN